MPPPRVNLTRYHGVLGPNSKLRKKIVFKHKRENRDKKKPRYKLSWMKLLKRVFDTQIDKCKCGGTLKVISAVLGIQTTTKILESLNIEVYIPELAPARGPPSFEDFY